MQNKQKSMDRGNSVQAKRTIKNSREQTNLGKSFARVASKKKEVSNVMPYAALKIDL